MPKIKIFRKRDWMISLKMFEVFLDEQRIGYLMKGETAEYEVPAGPHNIKIKMGMLGSKSIDFNVYNKETKSFTVSRSQMLALIFIILLLLAILMETYYRHTFKRERWVLVIIPVLIFLFHAFGTHIHFLNIKEN